MITIIIGHVVKVLNVGQVNRSQILYYFDMELCQVKDLC